MKKARQKQYLSRVNEESSIEAESVEIYKMKISISNFQLMMTCLCRVSFLTTLDIYKTYFKGHHTWRTHALSVQVPNSLWKKLLHLCALGFCNQVLLDLHCWWSEELCSQQSSSSWRVSHVLRFVQKVAFIYWRVQRFWSGRRFL